MKNVKFKRFIIIVCLFTFLFLPLSGKYEEPKAEILALSTGVIIACAALATACGVVITHPSMIEDIGTRVYDKIKDVEGVFETVEDKVKINVTNSLIHSLADYLVSLPKEDSYSNLQYPYNDGRFVDSSVSSIPIMTAGTDAVITVNTNGSGFVLIGNSSKWISTGTIEGAGVLDIFYTESSGKTHVLVNNKIIGGGTAFTLGSQLYLKYFNVDFTVESFNPSGSVCIPYTPENSENVSIDKSKEYFPAGSGSISAPINKPLTDYNVSVDKPIVYPSDLVSSDDIVIGGNEDITVPDTGVLDKPSIDVGDTPTTGEGLWDTLMGWLKTLFAPLISLLGWIGDILNSILSFLSSLVIPTEWGSLDWSPLYFSVADKFPFCIPFDMIRMIKEFQASEKEPVFDVDMSSFSSNKYSRGQVGFTIDLTEFDELIQIVKTLTLISFIFFIAFKTRDIIKG